MAGRIDDLAGMLRNPKDFQYYCQRLVQNVGVRERIAKRLADKLPGKSSMVADVRAEDAASKLQNDGIAFLPNLLDAAELDAIYQYALQKKCYDRTRPHNGDFFIDKPHPECHTAVYSDNITLNCPHVIDTVNHPLVLQAIEKTLGCKPTISNISMWWSLPGHASPEHAELFHRDVDDWRFFKLFIYITDVDAGAGPHVFVRGSQGSSSLTKIARYTDEEVEKAFGAENVLRLIADAGTSFLENTYGMHKGQLPHTKRRLLLQAQYSLHPISILNYAPQKLEVKPRTPLDPYVNRLYVV